MTRESPTGCRRDVLGAGLCAFISVLSVIISWPVAEIGPADDWSYTHTVKILAETGHWTYNGWASAMLGAQAYWAASAVRLFGFSFTVVRLSNLPFVAGAAAILFLLLRRARLPAPLAMLGAASVVLSPAYIPVAASFLTDVPAFFFVLIAIYAFTASSENAERSTRAILWLVLGALAAWIGGTIRQTVWLAPLAILPVLAFSSRKSLGIAITALGLWFASVGVVVLGYRWAEAQPFSTPESPFASLGLAFGSDPTAAMVNVSRLVTGGLTLLLPAIALLTPLLKRVKSRVILAAEFALIGTVLLVIYLRDSEGQILPPLLGNQFTAWGMLEPGIGMLGRAPVVLPLVVCVLLWAIVLFAAWMLAATGFAHLRANRRARHEPIDTIISAPPTAAWPAAMKLLLVFLVPYVAVLIPRAAIGMAFDRYLFPVLAAGTMFVLRAWSRVEPNTDHARARLIGLTVSWAFILLGGVVGIATTHDYYALARAQVAATKQITDAGIPRAQITAGIAYDGWTQLKITGHVNDPRVRNPIDGYQPASPRVTDTRWAYWFWPWTPDVQPMFYVSRSPLQGLAPSRFPPVGFDTWLPWGHSEVLISEGPPPHPPAE